MHRDGPKARGSGGDEGAGGGGMAEGWGHTSDRDRANRGGGNSRGRDLSEGGEGWICGEKTENSISACHHSTRILSLL